MKNIILCLAMCVAIAFGGNLLLSSPIPPSCAILDSNLNLYDVSSKYFNTTDVTNGHNWPLSVNLCLDMEKGCTHTSNEPCSVCQYVPDQSGRIDSYCLGYSRDEVYTPLDQNKYRNIKGFTAYMSGEGIYCPNGVPRSTYIVVLCGQSSQGIVYSGESEGTCTYNFTLSLTGDCSISAASFTPTFTITSVTPNAFTVTIDDGYPYEFWNYNVKVNGEIGYQGIHRDIQIENLDPATTYKVVVERDSGDGAVMNVISPSVTLSVTTLPKNLGSIHTPIVSGTGTGVLIGLVIAFALIVVVVGFLKLRASEWWADKFGGGSGSHRGGKGTFSLLDAEKSSSFEN